MKSFARCFLYSKTSPEIIQFAVMLYVRFPLSLRNVENFPLLTASYLVMWELVRQGAAIGILDAYIGDSDPNVKRVLPDLEPLIFPIWLVSHRELNTSRRIRRVFDFLAEELHRG